MRWLAVATLALAGCALGGPPRVGERPAKLADEAKEKAYAVTLARYTDQGELYDRFDTRLFAGATYQAWPFRQARVERVAEFQVLPEAVKAARLAEEQERHQAAHEVVLGVHVNEYRFDDFDRPTSIWRVVLVTQAGEFTPEKVERVGRADLALRALYPYLDDFWTVYRVTFPKTTPTGSAVVPAGQSELTLRIASTLGKVELTFAAE